MKRFLLLFLFLTISIKSFAQYDTEHWFAPMIDRSGNGQQSQRIYLSTAETTPFNVDIYHDNVVVGSVNVSKNSPSYYDIANREQIIVSASSGTTSPDTFKPVSKGLYLKGAKPFLAILKISVTNHAENITSKGSAGVGKNFRTVMAPIINNPDNDYIFNFMTSVMATEDNTNVKISEFNPSIRFSNNQTYPEITFTLNKGESYIIDGTVFNRVAANYSGFIGAKIEADKPVSVTNGNFNGQYLAVFNTSSDILLDQAISEDKLGKEHVLVKGKGDIAANTEQAIVVATEDNTEVWVNGILNATINNGDFHIIDSSKYIENGVGHYNLYINTSKNAYVYQLFSGNATGGASGGFISIPPLRACDMPTLIDEIGSINTYVINSVEQSVDTNLNIITKPGAVLDVKQNGISLSLTPTNGPFPVTGTSDWVSYLVPNVQGNVSISSNQPLTAGIIAGDLNVGYGGYYAGFATAKILIEQKGSCPSSVYLEVGAGLGTYQWQKKNIISNGYDNLIGENSNVFYPTAPGIYRVVISNSCGATITDDFKYLGCTIYSTQTDNVCDTLTITPSSSVGSQNLLASSITIIQQATKGMATVNSVAQTITYVPNPGETGTDTFKYSVKGDDTDTPENEEVLVTININGFEVKNASLTNCEDPTTREALFNLDLADLVVDPSSANALIVKRDYYLTRNGAENETASEFIASFTAYSSPESSVFVRIENSLGCVNIAEIELKFFPSVTVTPSAYTRYLGCDADFSGVIKVSLSDVTAAIVSNSTYFTSVRYYNTLTEATAGTTTGLPNNWTYSSDVTIFIRVDSPDGCTPVVEQLDFKVGPSVPLITLTYEGFICDDDLDGKITVANLNTYKSVFSSDATVNAKFYLTQSDAENDVNDITSVDVDQEREIFVRLYHAILCPSLATLKIKVNTPSQSLVLADKEICPDATTRLDAGSGFTKYEWYDVNNPTVLLGEGQLSPNLPVGKYFVVLMSANTCTYRQDVEIKGLQLLTIDSVEIQEQTVTVTASGGSQPYQYSLDGGPYQLSNVFNNVSNGLHTVNVISTDGCSPVTRDFSLIKMYNVITPNGDGYNDVIDMSLLKLKEDVKFEIYDRVGKRVFEGNPANNYTWTGKENGKPLATSSYWYILQWKDSANAPLMNLSGWILLKNRD